MESDRNGVSGWLLNRIYRTCNVSGMDGVFDTQNPEISGSSTAHSYKYKTKRQAEMKQRQQKNGKCTCKAEACAQNIET